MIHKRESNDRTTPSRARERASRAPDARAALDKDQGQEKRESKIETEVKQRK